MTRPLRAAELDGRRFPPASRDALFAAVLTNDVIDDRIEAPPQAPLDYDRDQLVDGFRLSRQLWRDGVDREALRGFADVLLRTGGLEPPDQVAFKHARARFKHLRFAFALYDEAHRCPPLLKGVTTSLGHLQDAFRGGRTAATARHAAVLRLATHPAAYALVAREADRLRPEDGAGFRAFALVEIARLRGLLATPALTAASFHAARKIVSRQVSFYDDMRVLQPCAAHHGMSRVLAAANGLMGAFHDRLVAQKGQGGRVAAFPWPHDMRQRLQALAALYPPEDEVGRRRRGGRGGHDTGSA